LTFKYLKFSNKAKNITTSLYVKNKFKTSSLVSIFNFFDLVKVTDEGKG